MITLNSSLFSLTGISKTHALPFKQAKHVNSASVNMLQKDTFEKTQNSKNVSSPISMGKTQPVKNQEFLQTYETVKELKKEKVIPEELFAFVEPVVNDAGEKEFTALQTKFIDSAQKRMNYYKDIAQELEKAGADAKEEVLDQVKEIFGGEEGLGRYVVARSKSQKSIFNKLVKEFKDESFYPHMMDRLSTEAYKKPYSLLNIEEYKDIADKHFKGKTFNEEQYNQLIKPYSSLNKNDKKLLLMALNDKQIEFNQKEIEDCIKIFKPTSKDHDKAVNYVKDLVGTRLILPNGSLVELEQVEKYISKAIRYGKIKITRMSNYHDNYILPYINYETAKKWKETMPGMVLVENKKVRKRNGYTTTQFNIVHPLKNKTTHKSKDSAKSKVSKKAQHIEENKLKQKYVFGELQIRTKKLNDIGQIEHLIYDILEGKDISQGIPELRKYYDSTGIEKAVNEVFNDDVKEENYIKYENSMYYFIRHNETRKKNGPKYLKPILSMYELKGYEILGFDSLARIDKEAEKIKEKFRKSQEKE